MVHRLHVLVAHRVEHIISMVLCSFQGMRTHYFHTVVRTPNNSIPNALHIVDFNAKRTIFRPAEYDKLKHCAMHCILRAMNIPRAFGMWALLALMQTEPSTATSVVWSLCILWRDHSSCTAKWKPQYGIMLAHANSRSSTVHCVPPRRQRN